MGYRIEYDTQIRRRDRSRRRLLGGLWFGLFLILVNVFWPEGRAFLKSLLFSGDAAVTAAALEELAEELKAGSDLSQSAQEFCRRVILGA